ncbi:MAG: hypothetical protein NTW08_02980 [Gammaproteobacteria bacterium]|nr:hypothetical protein [Gammaproteobacteria bacterium]
MKARGKEIFLIIFKSPLLFTGQVLSKIEETIVRIFGYAMVLACALFNQAFAGEMNYHGYSPTPSQSSSLTEAPTDVKPKIFGNCYVEIVNDSFSHVTVYGRYDDGVPLVPFDVYSYEYSHWIDMFYNGYCHSGMYLSVVTFSGYTIFSGYVFTGSTIHIVPSMGNKFKVEINKAEPGEVKK